MFVALWVPVHFFSIRLLLLSRVVIAGFINNNLLRQWRGGLIALSGTYYGALICWHVLTLPIHCVGIPFVFLLSLSYLSALLDQNASSFIWRRFIACITWIPFTCNACLGEIWWADFYLDVINQANSKLSQEPSNLSNIHLILSTLPTGVTRSIWLHKCIMLPPITLAEAPRVVKVKGH